ncbi:hypothetical protein [Roseococcus pinisoli]|uniref:Uncharacterized protein n=1 Tax=Roseococcus pinisoli TaxID=2835040 RepID=A0ABS5QA19_9PROT|nr:hypothetical protein [Roseococcus pinisoli]MBS7810554.1 hypothetical protein [Roseococcus pinisoli]
MAKRRARANVHYAMHAEEIQSRRAARLDAMSREELRRWLDRGAAYQRAYQRRWRSEIQSDPEAHRRYLDLQAEYRRRLALARLMVQATQLKEMLDE